MKVKALILLVALMVMMSATAAWAKPAGVSGKGKTQETVTEGTATADGAAEVEVSTKAKGSKGLQNAYANVKNPKAAQVLARILLTKYDINVTDAVYGTQSGTEVKVTIDVTAAPTKAELKAAAKELKAELKAAKMANKEKAQVLADVAGAYLESELTVEAAEFQKDAILADSANLELYKGLGVINKKLGKKGLNLFVNGVEPVLDVKPVIQKGRTLVPIRAISASLKADVQWDAKLQTVTITRGTTVIKLVIGSDVALVNGKEVKLDTPALVIKNRTVIPARFVSEALKATVVWETQSQTVVVNEQPAGTAGESTTTQN